MNFRITHILLLLSFLVLKAENFGSITGTITDSDKGTALPGVNIMVKGTYYGSSSDLEGRYRLNDISPGSYDIEVSMICLLYTSPSPRDVEESRMPSSA